MIPNNYTIASDPQLNVWVSASAGSGKTKTLIDRFLRLLLNKVNPEKILCVTFTKVAAAEMLNRIRTTLGEWSIIEEEKLKDELKYLTNIDPDLKTIKIARSLFNSFIENQDKLQIHTIHAFCQKLIIKFPIEAGIKINSILVTDDQKLALIEEAKNTFLNQYESEIKEPKFITYLLENIHEHTLDSLIERAIHISNVSNFSKEQSLYSSKASEILGMSSDNAEEKVKNAEERLSVEIRKSLDRLISFSLENDMEIISASIRFLKNQELSFESRISSLKNTFLTKDFSPRSVLLPKKIAILHEDILESLKIIQTLVFEYHNIEMSKKTFELTQGFLGLIYLFNSCYSKIKQKSGYIDYNDLINISLNLLEDESLTNWIESKLNSKISHIMVDESQDINLKQWQIIHTCLKDFFSTNKDNPNTVFVVGDKKQSIYSFQGSSPELFSGMNQFIEKIAKNFDITLHNINFSKSFRSDSIVLNFVDKLFKTISDKNRNYFCEDNLKHISNKNFEHASVEIWPLVVDAENKKDQDSYDWDISEGYKENYNPPKILANMIAKKIETLLIEGEFKPSDFMILVRKRDSLTNHLIKALKEHNLPVSGIDRLLLNENIAIKDLLSFMKFKLLPEDDYNLGCLLKSPIFSITEEELCTLCQREERSLWNNLKLLSDNSESFKKIHDTLEAILNNKTINTPYYFAAYCLDICGYRTSFLSRLGMHIDEVLDEFINVCLEFEETNEPSLISFIHWFQSAKVEIKKEINHESEEIKIMTIHASKGLQAKFIILPDTTTVPRNKGSIVFDQLNNVVLYNVSENHSYKYQEIIENTKLQTLQEYYRLLYVGLTRASQHILICGHSRSKMIPELCWYEIIRNTLKELGQEIDSVELHGYQNIANQAVCGDEDLYFLSDSMLSYKVEKGSSEKKSHIKQKTHENFDRPKFLSEKYVIQDSYHKISPSTQVREKDENINNALALGTLIHKALECFVALKRTIQTNEVRNFINAYKDKTMADIESEQIDNICTLINNFILPITSVNQVYTELKIQKNYKVENKNYILSGSIDLLVLEDKKIHIIDYKTDKQVPKTSYEIDDKYIKQLALYKKVLLERYPTHDVLCYLAWTTEPSLIKIDSNQLKKWLNLAF